MNSLFRHVSKQLIRQTLDEINNKVKLEELKDTDKPLVYDDKIEEELLVFSKMYDKYPLIKDNYSTIFKLSHPFELLSTVVESELVSKNVKITNAYMKMYEFLSYMSQYILKNCTNTTEGNAVEDNNTKNEFLKRGRSPAFFAK